MAGVAGMLVVEQILAAEAAAADSSCASRKRASGDALSVQPPPPRMTNGRSAVERRRRSSAIAANAGAALDRHRGASIRCAGGLDQHVLGQRQDHRARPACRRGGEGAMHELGDPGRIVDLGDPLGHAAEHRPVVDLLERVALAAAAVDLAHEQDHRQAVLLGDVHAGTGVGGTRATRDHDDARPAVSSPQAVGHHRRAALLAADDKADLGRVVQRVEDLEIALAGHAEDG